VLHPSLRAIRLARLCLRPKMGNLTQPGEAGTNRRLACQSSFFEQEVTEGTEELCTDAPACIAEIARCFWPKGSSSIPSFAILRFLLFKKIVANMATFSG
jgi:hypothetical protein